MQEIWTPQKGDILYCKKDNHSEGLEFDKHAVGSFKGDVLVWRDVPIELSRIISNFLQTDKTTEAKEKRKCEIGLKNILQEQELIAKILGDQLERILKKIEKVFFFFRFVHIVNTRQQFIYC